MESIIELFNIAINAMVGFIMFSTIIYIFLTNSKNNKNNSNYENKINQDFEEENDDPIKRL